MSPKGHAHLGPVDVTFFGNRASAGELKRRPHWPEWTPSLMTSDLLRGVKFDPYGGVTTWMEQKRE